MAGGYSVRVLVRSIFIFYFRYGIRMLISKMISLTFFHCTFYSDVLKLSDRKAICSQAREIVGGLNRHRGGS